MIYGLGMIESGITMDYGQLVMDNEFAGMIKKTIGGMPVNDQTLSLDIIHEIGPFGDFVSHDSTFDHMRSQSQPSLIDRNLREPWDLAGGKDLYARARERAAQLLDTHRPLPIPDRTLGQLRSIINEAESELGVPLSES